METKETTTVKTITEPKKIKAPLFLMFAEFLGYTSEFIEYANDMCDGKKVDDFIKDFIEIDALHIFNKMKEKNELDEIREMWDSYYEVILKDYDEILEKEALPF